MIIATYSQEPSWPAERQNVDAQRIQIGSVWVDYVSANGAAPSQADLDSYFQEPLAKPIDAEELYDMLESKGLLSAPDRPRPKPLRR